jgi:hypothetical protein
MYSTKAMIAIKESHIKGFPVVEPFLGKRTGSPKYPSDPLPQPASIPFYPYRVLFSPVMTARMCRHEALPTVRCYSIVALIPSHFICFFTVFVFPFPLFPVIRLYEPYSVLLLPRILQNSAISRQSY